ENHEGATQADGDAVEGPTRSGGALEELQKQEQFERRERPDDPEVGPEVGLELDRDGAEAVRDYADARHPAIHAQPPGRRPDREETDPELYLVEQRDRERQGREAE